MLDQGFWLEGPATAFAALKHVIIELLKRRFVVLLYQTLVTVTIRDLLKQAWGLR